MPLVREGVWVEQAGWDDVPHLSESEKRRILASTPSYLHAARSRGEPTVGRGRIYPFDWADVIMPPTQIPKHWPRFYGLDVGWKITAAVFCARDPDTDLIYVYTEYYQGRKAPLFHAAALKQLGADWIPGVIDPAARASNQEDGSTLFDHYVRAGLKLSWSKDMKAIHGGIAKVTERLQTGRLKFNPMCTALKFEFEQYRMSDDPDEKTHKPVARHNHAMDSLRYAIMAGPDVEVTRARAERGSTDEKGRWRTYTPADARAGY